MSAILFVIGKFIQLLSLAIVIDALLSWVPYNETVYKIRQVLSLVTEPIVSPIRKLLSPITSGIGIDFSPVVAIILIDLVGGIIMRV